MTNQWGFDMNRNIEVGCLVLILNTKTRPDLVGAFGTVEGIDDGKPYRIGETDKFASSPGNWDVKVPGNKLLLTLPGRWLLRIDNYDASTDTVTTEQEQMS